MTTTLFAQMMSAPTLVPPRSADGEAFRRGLSRLAAGVSIVTTADVDGQLLGMTATAVSSVSLDPPLLLVCVDNRSRTVGPLRGGASFIVHFLAAEQEDLARQFASRTPDKFAGVAYRISEQGCPRLEGVLASVECLPHACYPGGDHTIVVGRVIDVRVSEDEGQPLLYFRGKYLR